uniref:Speckle-type POZ protein (inferred by orthology to a human protein) n=1 Tax=Strongyloides papillosus TaxID=174720 RepID=A0A0N5C1Z2_STREA
MPSNESSSKSNDQFTCEKIVEKASTKWSIEKFSACKEKTGDLKKSSIFKSKTDDKVKWSLILYPKGFEDKSRDHISLYLQLEETDNVDVTTMCRFYVLNQEGEKKFAETLNIKFNKTMKREGCSQFLKTDLILKNDSQILVNDTLTLGCEIFYICCTPNTVTTSTTNNPNQSLSTLTNDYGRILESSKFYDCVIKSGDSEIYAHRCILSDRSEVFDSILTEKQNECTSNIIEINDFSPKVVKEMIKYLYTGKLPNIDGMACEMLAIGDKYKLKPLKSAAEESLMEKVEIDNVCDYLIKSELYSAKTLQEWCLRFISLNPKSVEKNVEWEKVVNNYPLLVGKLFYYSTNTD